MSEIVSKLIKKRVQNKVNEVEKVASTKAGQDIISEIASSMNKTANRDKSAALIGNFKDATKGMAAGLGVGAGVTGAAYEYKQRSQPTDEDLNRILKKNPEIERQYDPSEIRTTFDSLKVHIPRMLKQDPYGSGQIMKKMLSKEGYDVRSLDKVLDIEKKKQDMEGEVFDKMSSANSGQTKEADATNSFFKKVAARAREINNKNQQRNENYQDDFNELKNLFNDE